jgi:hypothetical protein
VGIKSTIASLAQPMNFFFARLNQSASLKPKKNSYLDYGYNLDSYSGFGDQRQRLNTGERGFSPT